MTQPLPAASPPQEIPESFFASMATQTASSTGLLANLGHPLPAGGHTMWQPQKVLPWYDAIIDDMFANPGCTMKETAARLHRSPVTIGLITRSDLFKARYAQRRAAYNEEIQHRLTGKLIRVAEAALDHTLVALDKKKDSIPLPLLTDIQNRALDRLGYGVQAKNPSVAVQVNTGGGEASVQVSPSALADARETLRKIEARNAAASALPEGSSGPVLEGSVVGAP